MKIRLEGDVTAEDLVEASTRDWDDLIELIKDIDGFVAEWGFTLRLYEHFAQLKAEHDKDPWK